MFTIMTHCSSKCAALFDEIYQLCNPINGSPKFLYLPLNLTLTIALTLLTLLTLLLSTVFNTVQEFGTAVYRIADFCLLKLFITAESWYIMHIYIFILLRTRGDNYKSSKQTIQSKTHKAQRALTAPLSTSFGWEGKGRYGSFH